MTTTIPGYFGEAPTDLGPFNAPDWHEMLHYLYLPVRLPLADGGHTGQHIVLPDRLAFLYGAVAVAISNAIAVTDHLSDPYVYVTARRGYATPGSPLNRPGWHTDDFDGNDLNYVWSDRWPTRVLLSDMPLEVSSDDAESMEDMKWHADRACPVRECPCGQGRSVVDMPAGHLMRLTPWVIHDTPIIPEPGLRSFFKISVSAHRYNLLGNSHNYLLDYDWPMADRAPVRNHQPAPVS